MPHYYKLQCGEGLAAVMIEIKKGGELYSAHIKSEDIDLQVEGVSLASIVRKFEDIKDGIEGDLKKASDMFTNFETYGHDYCEYLKP